MRAENYDGKLVNILGLETVVREKLPIIDLVHWATVGREGITTSGNDREHSAESLHYKGLAIDVRTGDLEYGEVTRLISELNSELGDSWDVVREPTHIHIEYDP